MVLSTIAGSLPKPSWLASPDQLWASWIQEDESLVEAHHDAVALAVQLQETSGIDVVTDGEQTRRHFVTTFIEALDGVDAFNRETVRIRRRYDASVPRVVGNVSRHRPVFVQTAQWLRGLTGQPIKFTLPGPMTMADTVSDHHYRDRERLARDFAVALNEEARELVEAGVDTIQFDEPAFNVFLDDVGAWGLSTLESAAAGIENTAVHICYGYGVKANIDWKQTLGDEWRQYEVTFPLLAESSIDQISIEIAGSRVPLELLELLGSKVVQAGVIDVATDRIESADEVAKTLERLASLIPVERLLASTNCGMVPLGREVASRKLAALGAGAKLLIG